MARTTFLYLLTFMISSSAVASGPPEMVFFLAVESPSADSRPAPSDDLLSLPGYPQESGTLTLAGLVYTPDPAEFGLGPYPTVLVLHGSGGLWSNDVITKGPSSQFADWAKLLTARGYLCFFPDSYKPRGISGNYANRRPHYDPERDDSLCSPNFERPKDVIAALTYLASRKDVNPDQLVMIGFSHGAQTGLNVLLDPSVEQSAYRVRYVQEDGKKVFTEAPAPVRIPDGLPFPKAFACYYPGCGHHGYHGRASTITAKRYMPDRRTKVIMFHGTLDPLLGVDNPDEAIKTGKLFPLKLVESSRLQAESLRIPNPFVDHLIFANARHSFDGKKIKAPDHLNPDIEKADKIAKGMAREVTLTLFENTLTPPQGSRKAIHPVGFKSYKEFSY